MIIVIILMYIGKRKYKIVAKSIKVDCFTGKEIRDLIEDLVSASSAI